VSSELISHQAVGTLYRDHCDWLVGLLRRRLGGNVDHAADLAHDTFERVMRKGVAPGMHEPRAYLTTVASRLVISHYRRAALEMAYLEALAQRPEPTAPSAQERAEVIEVLDQICEMIDRLDARSRRIFLLAQIDGLAYAEVAARMQVSIDVVKRTMSKALQSCYMAMYA